MKVTWLGVAYLRKVRTTGLVPEVFSPLVSMDTDLQASHPYT